MGNAWLVGLESDYEDSDDDQAETAQDRDESGWDRESGGNLTTHDEQKNRRGQRNPIPQDDSEFAPGDAALGANAGLQLNSYPTTSKSTIDTTIMTLADVASTGSSLIRKGSMKLGFMADVPQSPGESFQGPQDTEEKTDPQCSTNMSPK